MNYVRVYLCSMHALFWVYVLLTMNHPGNPFTNLGAWLDARARCKTLRLLHATAPGAARFYPWVPWDRLSIRDSGERDPREPTCACGLCFPGVVVIHETERCGPGVGVPIALAQRILAELERVITSLPSEDFRRGTRALAAELRARVEGKS